MLTFFSADLELHNNELKGTIPGTFQYMKDIRRITIDSNALSGTLPTEWGAFSALEALGMVSLLSFC